MKDEMEATDSTTEGESAADVGTPDSWRNTTTQERDTLVGHKLQEVSKAGQGGRGRRLLYVRGGGGHDNVRMLNIEELRIIHFPSGVVSTLDVQIETN